MLLVWVLLSSFAFCFRCECGTPMSCKFFLFAVSVGFCQPAWAERIIDLGYDLHGSRWRVVRQPTGGQQYLPLSVLSVEFPKLRHFRQHRDVKTVRLVVRLMCEKRDMAIEHFVFHDEAGREVAHLAGNSASHGYAELLPLAMKTSLFDSACAESP